MSRVAALAVSMLLLLLTYPLVSIGTMQQSPVLWWSGLIALGIGGIIPPARRLWTKRQQAQAATRAGLMEDERVS